MINSDPLNFSLLVKKCVLGENLDRGGDREDLSISGNMEAQIH